MTIRNIIDKLTDCVDFDTSHYIFSSIILPFADGKERIFSTLHDNDKDNRMAIVLGKDCSTFKKGHIKTVYCVLPREAITPEIEKYRDIQDPYMYKYYLPERVFNSILNQFPIDLDATIQIARNHYAQSDWKWEGEATWKKKVKEWFGWEFKWEQKIAI